MFAFLQKFLGNPASRPGLGIALYGPRTSEVDLLNGLDWILKWASRLGLPEAESVTLNYGGPGDRHYKTHKLAAWTKRGRPLPSPVCTSIETVRSLPDSKGGMTDEIWYASLSAMNPALTLVFDLNAASPMDDVLTALVADIQSLAVFDYGYVFRMPMEKSLPTYVAGLPFGNPLTGLTQAQEEAINKWGNAKGACSSYLNDTISHYLRDIYPLNFLNPHHMAMRVKGQSLKDWIEADPKRGSLKPLIENQLWAWQVPENRIEPVRKVLGKERLLISWGDFNTPSGGPLGHTYGPQRGKQKPMEFPYPHRPFTEVERKQLDAYLDHAAKVFERYTGERYDRVKKTKLIFKLLDLAFESWTKDQSPDKASGDRITQAFGAALGQALADRLGMEWAHVDDNGWVDAVVHFKSRTIAYPFDSMAKRVEAGEYGFIQGIYQAVQEQMRRG